MKFLNKLIIFSSLLFAIFTVYADTQIVVTGVPRAREVSVAPDGFLSCYQVPPQFHHGVWRDQHRVCKYSGPRAQGLWIAGYWMCTKFKHHHNTCKHWSWQPSHFEGQRPPSMVVQAPGTDTRRVITTQTSINNRGPVVVQTQEDVQGTITRQESVGVPY